ncbi:hypothetical protein SCORR_v1c05300 [Spiroplasma corruscae]|uniref:ABC transporter ATP-binding protein n=1 Tax=Spiroplasma corruscae TaxID=216934 RepID=A0A222EP90_9MOLU|nr:ABC transporter ATP-binding protein [Spiroplasma corruscae]ASP28302.1 hypothetical protein SCORR_v1c05300 [Spiroplasma corruscae]
MTKIYLKVWYFYLIYLLFATISSAGMTYGILSSGYVLDDVLNNDKTKLIIDSIFIIAGIAIFSLFSNFNNFIIKPRAIKKMNLLLRKLIIDKINAMSYEEYSSNGVGTYISWLTNDVDIIESTVFESSFTISNIIPQFFIIGYSFYSLNWILGLIAISSSLLCTIIPFLFVKSNIKYQTKISSQSELLSEDLLSYVNGYQELSYRNKKRLYTELVNDANLSYEKTKSKFLIFRNFQSFLSNMITISSQSILVIVSLYLFTINKTSAGAFLSSPGIAYTFFVAIFTFSRLISTIKSTKEVVLKYKNVKVENDYEPSTINFENIIVKDLNYSVEDKIIFKDFNLSIKNHNKYLLIGESGKGKTTLFKIIFSLIHNYEGEIKINNKLNYKDIDQRDIWNLISYIPQENILYNSSLKNNITLFNKTINDSEVIDVLNKVNLGYLLDQMSLNDHLNNDANNISGGEIQRIAIARALLQDKPFMILDEITSGLDEKNRNNIESLILSLNKTILYISHTTKIENNNFDQIIKL